MSSRTALVTGAAGFVGSHLSDRLLADGWTVVAVDSFEDYYDRRFKERNLVSARAHARFELIENDILSLAESGELAALCARVDAVFHLAAQAGVRASWGKDFDIYARNNILATQVLLETCRHNGNPRVVYASSSSVYGDTAVLPMREDAACWPHSPYGVSKLAAEHLCRLYHRNFGLPTVSLRFFTVYGPRQRPDMAFHKFARTLLEGGSLDIFGDGTQTRDFTYVSDIVQGLVLALDAPSGAVFNLGGGSRVTLAEAIEALGAAAGVEAAFARGDVQPGDVKDTSAWLENSRDILHYAPEVSLADGLAAEVAWMREIMAEGL